MYCNSFDVLSDQSCASFFAVLCNFAANCMTVMHSTLMIMRTHPENDSTNINLIKMVVYHIEVVVLEK